MRLAEAALDLVGERVGVSAAGGGCRAAGAAAVVEWGRWAAPEEMRGGLYAGLRALDGEGCTVILCPLPPSEGLARLYGTGWKSRE